LIPREKREGYMLKIGKESKLKPEEVIQKAVDYYGPKGYGLKVTEKDIGSVYLVGGGGSVRVSAIAGQKGSSVDIESVEWDYQTKEFLQKIK
jgi:hypothetical protein